MPLNMKCSTKPVACMPRVVLPMMRGSTFALVCDYCYARRRIDGECLKYNMPIMKAQSAYYNNPLRPKLEEGPIHVCTRVHKACGKETTAVGCEECIVGESVWIGEPCINCAWIEKILGEAKKDEDKK